jgi:translation initiation factor 5A
MFWFNSYIVIKGRPCKVSDVSTSKTGKHGHAKCNFTAIDIFTNKKLEDIIPSTHATTVPVVTRKEYSLVDISGDDFVSLMDEEGNVREDIKLPEIPEGFAREIREAFEAGKTLSISVMAAMGHEQIIAMKEESEAKA